MSLGGFKRIWVCVGIVFIYSLPYYIISVENSLEGALFKTLLSSVAYLIYIQNIEFTKRKKYLRLKIGLDLIIALVGSASICLTSYESLLEITLNMLFFGGLFLYISSGTTKRYLEPLENREV